MSGVRLRSTTTQAQISSAPAHAHFAMVEKAALHNLDQLMREDMQAARMVVSLIRLMEPGSGGVVVASNRTLQSLLGISESTVKRALRTLIAGHWVQRMRIGGAHALAINRTVAWVGPRGDLDHAVFGATVIASREEQDAIALDPGELRQIPVAHPSEMVLPHGIEPPPPNQPGLDGMEPAVARTKHATDDDAQARAELERRGQRRLTD